MIRAYFHPVRDELRRVRVALALVLAAAACADGSDPISPNAATIAPQYAPAGFSVVSVVGLEPLLDATRNWSVARDVSDAGQVVGVSNDAADQEHAVLWDNSPYPTDLGALGEWSRAEAITSDGSVIAGSSASGSTVSAVRWIKPGDAWILDPLPAYGSSTNCQALDVGDDGTIVGRCVVPGAGMRAIVWQNGSVRDLGIGSATAANGQGQVVGMSSTTFRPTLWALSSGSSTPLGPADITGTASDVDAVGNVVGNYETATSDGPHAFLWTAKKEMVYLESLPGTVRSSATGVNGSQIVGDSEIGLDRRATLWQRGKAFDLGVLPGYASAYASAVNGRGQIVGASSSDGGAARATMWTVK